MSNTRIPPRPAAPRVRENAWVEGVLVAHGAAPYDFDSDNAPSYFARLRLSESDLAARRRIADADQSARPIDGRGPGQREDPEEEGTRVFWGKDLQRAIRDSKSQVRVGDRVAVRVVRHDPVGQVDDPRSPTGKRDAFKKRFEVEKPQFIKRRVEFAREVNESYQGARRSGADGPEALALYLIHDGARRFAEARFPDPADQQRFLDRVRNFFDVSPDREAVIARAAEKLRLRNRSEPDGAVATSSRSTTARNARRPPRTLE